MLRPLPIFLLIVTFAINSNAQTEYTRKLPDNLQFSDSTLIKVHPSYANKTTIHNWLFGKNYRKEWSASVKLPLLRLSKINGGLTPVKEGGGMQSKSLRLRDKNGKEYVIRSVEKTPDKLLPENFRGTFAIDWIDDAMSGQHPFSALIVPPLASAANVHHTNPIIAVVAADENLGEYNKEYTGMVVLFEEREPAGNSDNTPKMISELNEDNDHRIDGRQFLRARMLDLLIGDWDRHEDQWRWVKETVGNGKIYQAVPRDRDQVFHVNEGVFPTLAALPWISPLLGDFTSDLSSVKYSLYKTRFLNAYPDIQLSYSEWMEEVHAFTQAETDAVLEEGLRRLPKEIYSLRHDKLFSVLKQRRDGLPEAMDRYYRFVNRIVDIRTSDKNEDITITEAANNGAKVVIRKINKEGQVEHVLLDRSFDPDTTQEIRIYTGNGKDQLTLQPDHAKIRFRIIAGEGSKQLLMQESSEKVKLYAQKKNVELKGDLSSLKVDYSNDSLQTAFVPVNPYNLWMPLATAALNRDDGFLLGLGVRFIRKDGYKKIPYSSSQQLMITHSFATSAFRIKYNGEWIQALGNADITLQAFMQAPDNTQNFFGRGNETALVKSGDYRRFYRTRFDTYQVDPALRWHTGENSTFSAGPSVQFYHLNFDDNYGRLITQTQLIRSYDSVTVNRDKAHAGLLLNFNSNQRNNNILPSKGYYVNVTLQGYTGLNHYSRSYLQIRPEFSFYLKLNEKGSVVLSERIGGGVTFGDAAFYQSMFLGGQGNLLGYLQNRFAGEHMIYNNIQARVKLLNIASYILPGQLGLTGFFDTGRVWEDAEHSDKWHLGKGGGVYFSPAGLTILQLMAGHSREGWYPYFSMNFRI